MSIYVKDMKMPEICNVCGFCQRMENATRYKFIYCGADKKDIPNLSKRRSDCPLIELPPLSRLIDADALKKEAKMLNAHYNYRKVVDLSDIDNAPTIVETEE